MSSGVVPNLTQQGNYYVDASGGVYVNVLVPISNFPYFQRSVTVVTPNSGSYCLFTGKKFDGQSGCFSASMGDAVPSFGNYGPLSWRIGADTTAIFYNQRNFTGSGSGSIRTYGPGTSQSDTFAVNPYPFLSIAISSSKTTFVPLQQVGTYIGGKYIWWAFSDIIANMTNVLYSKQNSDPANYTGPVVQSLLASINALDCNALAGNYAPNVPNMCDAYNAAKAAAAAAKAQADAVAAEQKAKADAIAAQQKAQADALAAAVKAEADAAAAAKKAQADAAAKGQTTTTTPAASTSATTTTSDQIFGLNKYLFWGIIAAVILVVLISSSAGVYLMRRKKAMKTSMP